MMYVRVVRNTRVRRADVIPAGTNDISDKRETRNEKLKGCRSPRINRIRPRGFFLSTLRPCQLVSKSAAKQARGDVRNTGINIIIIIYTRIIIYYV